MARTLISAKDIIKHYNISYSRINYLTKKRVLKITARRGKERLYSLEDIEEILGGKKTV